MEFKTYDYILITDERDERFLEIGKVVEVEHEYGNLEWYLVRFKDLTTKKYDYELEYKARRILFDIR